MNSHNHEVEDAGVSMLSPSLSPSLSPRKRRHCDEDDIQMEDEPFHTAPNSPSKLDSHGDRDWESTNRPDLLDGLRSVDFDAVQPSRLFRPNNGLSLLQQFKQSQEPLHESIDLSISSVSASSDSIFPERSIFLHSFDTEITEPDGTQSTYADSIVGLLTEEGLELDKTSSHGVKLQERIMKELVEHSPFTLVHPLPGKLPLRYRYKFEGLGRAWDIPLERVYRGDVASWRSQEDFWAWIQQHNQRHDRPLPKRSSRRAWDHALRDFKTDTPSEVVILSGAFNWCSPGEPGIFKLQLNPLKTEQTCRFHRRFGSDRFLTLTIPAPSRPPPHHSYIKSPSARREAIAQWLTGNDHHSLGRTWRAFYVEEVKSKRKVKAEPRFRCN